MPPTGPREWSPQGGPPGSLARFIHQNGITLTYEAIPERPDRKDLDEKEQEWQDRAFHYKVTLRRGRKKLTTYYSAGAGSPESPTVDEVLDILASDSSGADNARSFEDWASEYGYDTDSRKAERTFRAVQETSEKLKQLLGEGPFQELVYKIDRL